VTRPVPRRGRWLPPAALTAVAAAWLVVQSSVGDYPADAGPALRALVTGDVGRALALQPLMGSVALAARLPFALAAHLAGWGTVGMYRAGIVPCLAATAAIGLWLVRLRREDAGSRAGDLAIPLLAVLTPASLSAVQKGHPEEALAAALAVAAVLLADRTALWAGLALGLAVATKQWAVLAVAPALWAAPRDRRGRMLGVAALTAALLTLPLVLGSPSAFSDTGYNAATAPRAVGRATVWFLLAAPHHLRLHLPPGFPDHGTVFLLPAWIARLSHPLIVLLSPLAAALVWRRRRAPGDALALLALVLLLRCALDPVDNEYYHLPFLLALLAYESVARRDVRGLPVATLWCSAGLWLTFDRLDALGATPGLTNAVYLTWVAIAAGYLLHALGALRLPRRRVRGSRARLGAVARG
jgi:hypothetical protein